MVAMIMVVAVPMMHEEVHQWAGKEEQIGREPKTMLPMVAKEPEESGCANRCRQHDRKTY